MDLQSTTAKPWQFKPGVSGNPAGRPVGARQRFSAAFLEDLAEVWGSHGRAAMLACAKQDQRTFFAVCARLIPADVKLTVEQTYSGLGPEELAILQGVKETLPAANSESPQAVLGTSRKRCERTAQKLSITVRKMPLLRTVIQRSERKC
jgi:hypothetical protein